MVAKRARSKSTYKRMPKRARTKGSYSKPKMGEVGYVDLAVGTYNCDTTGSIALLNTVPQGAGTSQRVGKKIKLKSLQMRGGMANNSTAVTSNPAYMIVYDKRPTGTLPAITDILDTAHSASFLNDNNTARFQILKRVDQMMTGNPSSFFNQTSVKNADRFINLRGKIQVFNNVGTGAIGDIDQGALYLVTVGDVAAGTSASTLAAGFRLRYWDV